MELEAEWRLDAVCMQTDPEAFFPEKGGSTEEARRVCFGCPVIDDCLRYALEHDERFGIWGGTSERERRKLRKKSGHDRGAGRLAPSARSVGKEREAT